ncbi:MAG: T9SS type A sorting domain-containing protein [Cytophagales bacterium]
MGAFLANFCSIKKSVIQILISITITCNTYSQSFEILTPKTLISDIISDIKVYSEDTILATAWYCDNYRFIYSYDAGKNWINADHFNESIHDFKKLSGTIYLDNKDNIYLADNGDTVNFYKSTDAGQSFNGLINHSAYPDFKNYDIIDFDYKEDIIFLLTKSKEYDVKQRLYKSFDNGISWQFITLNSFSQNRDIEFLNADTGFITLDHQILITENGGNTWNPFFAKKSSLSPIFWNRKLISFEEDFLIGSSYDSMYIFDFRSLGTQIHRLDYNSFYIGNLRFIDDHTIMVNDDSATSAHDQVAMMLTLDLNTFEWDTLFVQNSILYPQRDIVDWDVSGENVLLHFTNPFNLVYSKDLLNTQRNLFSELEGDVIKIVSINENTSYCISEDKRGGFVINGENGAGSLYKSENNGKNWRKLKKFTSEIFDIEFLNESFGAVITKDKSQSFFGTGSLYISTDSGESWNLVLSDSSIYFDVEISATGTIFVTGNDFILKSDDNGQTWQNTNTVMGSSSEIHLINDTLGYFLVHFTSSDIFFSTSSKLFKTENGGLSWNTLRSFGPGVKTIEFPDSKTIYVSLRTQDVMPYGGSYASFDAGQSWEEYSIPSFELMKFVNNEIGFGYLSNYQETNFELHYSIDSGRNWGLIENNCLSIKYFEFGNDSSITFGGHSGLIYRSEDLYALINNSNLFGFDISKTFVLPNPTFGSIQLMVNGYSDYEIYSSQGSLMQKGKIENREIEFNSLKRGVYILKIISEGKELRTRVIKQ